MLPLPLLLLFVIPEGNLLLLSSLKKTAQHFTSNKKGIRNRMPFLRFWNIPKCQGYS